MYTFWKSISSNNKDNNLKIRKNNNNYTSINNNNIHNQGMNSTWKKNKDISKRNNYPKEINKYKYIIFNF